MYQNDTNPILGSLSNSGFMCKNETELQFANDSKLFRKIIDQGDEQQFQDYLDNLVKWSQKSADIFSILGNANAYTQSMEMPT